MADIPHYKRREHHEADGVAHYLTFSCYRCLRLFANDSIKDRFVERLGAIRTMRVISWVVMPEHVHLLIAREDDVSMRDLLRAIKKPFAREILNRWRTLGWSGLAELRDEKGHHFWQEGGGYDRMVYGREFREKIAYTHANPCRRGSLDRLSLVVRGGVRRAAVRRAGDRVRFGATRDGAVDVSVPALGHG